MKHAAWILLWSALLGLSIFSLEGDLGIDLRDEGFLWYGSQAVARGELPLRDFQSYDPGRYLWTAGGSLLFGDGLRALRLSCALFGVIGCALGMAALWRAQRSLAPTLLAGVLLWLWMSPAYKLFEAAISLAGIWAGARLLARPGRGTAAAAGVLLGLAACFGRNHLLYCGLGLGALVAHLLAHGRWRREFNLPALGGTLLGASPLLALCAFAPGFAGSLVESIGAQLGRGATNWAVPVPWPWTVEVVAGHRLEGLARLALGAGFVLLPLGYLFALALVLPRAKEVREDTSLALAGCAMGLPYVHFAFARADAVHLAHALPALVITLLALPRAGSMLARRVTLFAGLLVLLPLSLLAPLKHRPAWHLVGLDAGELVECEVGGETLRVESGQARALEAIGELPSGPLAPEEELLVAPYGPGVYALLRRHSPVWEIYFLWSPGAEREEETIRALEARGVRWVLTQDLLPLDGMPGRAFEATHPLLSAYLARTFEPFATLPGRGEFRLLRRRAE